MENRCPCGGKLVPCTLNTAFSQTQSVTVPNGYAIPKTYYVNALLCEKCGRIELYAEIK